MRRVFLIVALLGAAPRAFAIEPIPDKLVVLTFDDASKSHIQVAAPLLKRYGFGATFFVTEGFDFVRNKRDYMTWEEIKQLHQLGFEIGNHTRDHKAPSSKDREGTLAQLEAINERCREHGIPRPVSFAYPGNAIDRNVLETLKHAGIRFARRGGAPEYPYDQGQGVAYEPGLDHPLLIPSAGDGRPGWNLENFKQAVGQARNGRIAVIQLHGVPDTAHSWVNTPAALFESYLEYLAKNQFRVIAMRDLARYVDPEIVPSNAWGVVDDRILRLAQRKPLYEARPAKSRSELLTWVERMRVHGFTSVEMATAFGMDQDRLRVELGDHLSSSTNASNRERLLVLPYPGGRHPRTGFLDGAIRPQRETKVSVFAPWKDGGYAVADVPEAVWHTPRPTGRQLLYLAHTHVPTIWDERKVELEPLEWVGDEKSGYRVTRVFPNQVSMTSRVDPEPDGVRFTFSINNGSKEKLSGLDVQMCVMLKGLKGFERQTNENKVFRPPFAAAGDASGQRWIVTAWKGCRRAWGNAPCPCLHSDPLLADCDVGATSTAQGWISFYQGKDIEGEIARLRKVLAFD